MLVEIKRTWETSRSVCSRFCITEKDFLIFGLEPARVNPVIPGHPLITAGEFKVILSMSPHLHYETPEVLDVPGRTKIRWHIGNIPANVEGCTAVGLTHQVDWVGHSKVAFKQMMDILETDKDNIRVIYREEIMSFTSDKTTLSDPV